VCKIRAGARAGGGQNGDDGNVDRWAQIVIDRVHSIVFI